MTFADKVRRVVRRIPKGKVMTYGDVAIAAGSPGGGRAVGTVMKGNFDAEVPCHRVVRSDLRVGDYNRAGGSRTKSARLIAEGVLVKSGRVDRRSLFRP